MRPNAPGGHEFLIRSAAWEGLGSSSEPKHKGLEIYTWVRARRLASNVDDWTQGKFRKRVLLYGVIIVPVSHQSVALLSDD